MDDPKVISIDVVQRVARLARLRPSAAEASRYLADLSSILDHVAQLHEVDVEGVEPMSYPATSSMTGNRLAIDEVQAPLPFAALELNAPSMEDRLLAVPKVIGDPTEGG